MDNTVTYAQKSAPLAPYEDWGVVLFGVCAVCLSSLKLAAKPIRRLARRPGARASMLALLGIGGSACAVSGLAVFDGDTLSAYVIGVVAGGLFVLVAAIAVYAGVARTDRTRYS